MDKIIDNLYLGDIRAAANLFLLKQHGVTHVLQVLAGLNPCFPAEITYKVINIMDVPWENIGKQLPGAIRFIKDAINSGGTVFVHCYAGQSRSATCVIAYLMQEKNQSLFQAMGFVKSKRSVIFPNPGFQRQLLDFEKKLINNRKNTKQIADSMSKSTNMFQSHAISPSSFIKSGMMANGNPGADGLTSKAENSSYKPKYRNLRDAYDEFKALKKSSQRQTLHNNDVDDEEYIRISGHLQRVGRSQGHKPIDRQIGFQVNKPDHDGNVSLDLHHQTSKERSNKAMRRMKLKQQQKQQLRQQHQQDDDTHGKLRRDDDKPEPHYPKTQEREHRIKSAFKQCNLKMLDNNRDRSSSVGQSVTSVTRYSKFKSSKTVGPNHYLARNGDAPMPRYNADQQSTGFVRNAGPDKDDVLSVISQARSLLGDGRLNSSNNAYNMQGLLAGAGGQLTQQDLAMRPTSSYLCAHCKTQLFTNLDILIHEQVTTNKDEQRKEKSNNNVRASRQQLMLSSEEPDIDAEIATIADFGGKASQSAKNQFSPEVLDKYLPIQYIDPLTGQKKCEYRCYNIFTTKLANMVETDQRYGFLFCPNGDCGSKVGIFSQDGQKCQTCLAKVVPAFQWFRSRLVQHKYGEGGNNLNQVALAQLNGLSNDSTIFLGPSRKTPKKVHSMVNGGKVKTRGGGDHQRQTRAHQKGFKSQEKSRKFGELMTVQEKIAIKKLEKQRKSGKSHYGRSQKTKAATHENSDRDTPENSVDYNNRSQQHQPRNKRILVSQYLRIKDQDDCGEDSRESLFNKKDILQRRNTHAETTLNSNKNNTLIRSHSRQRHQDTIATKSAQITIASKDHHQTRTGSNLRNDGGRLTEKAVKKYRVWDPREETQSVFINSEKHELAKRLKKNHPHQAHHSSINQNRSRKSNNAAKVHQSGSNIYQTYQNMV